MEKLALTDTALGKTLRKIPTGLVRDRETVSVKRTSCQDAWGRGPASPMVQ